MKKSLIFVAATVAVLVSLPAFADGEDNVMTRIQVGVNGVYQNQSGGNSASSTGGSGYFKLDDGGRSLEVEAGGTRSSGNPLLDGDVIMPWTFQDHVRGTHFGTENRFSQDDQHQTFTPLAVGFVTTSQDRRSRLVVMVSPYDYQSDTVNGIEGSSQSFHVGFEHNFGNVLVLTADIRAALLHNMSRSLQTNTNEVPTSNCVDSNQTAVPSSDPQTNTTTMTKTWTTTCQNTDTLTQNETQAGFTQDGMGHQIELRLGLIKPIGDDGWVRLEAVNDQEVYSGKESHFVAPDNTLNVNLRSTEVKLGAGFYIY